MVCFCHRPLSIKKYLLIVDIKYETETMKAELTLSRPRYRAGNAVVGTVRIYRDRPITACIPHDIDDECSQRRQRREQEPASPMRQEIVSARLYLAGRAHLGSSAKWRSTHEVNQLKNIYGERHPCLTMAVMEEQSRWSAWNGDDREILGEDGSIDDDDRETFNRPKRTFCKNIDPPQVTLIEQAERLAVHSCLHHSMSVESSSSNDQPSNDFSHLPAPHENNVICLWMTNALELLDIPERHLDRKCSCSIENCKCQLRPGGGNFFGDMHPFRPLQLPDLNVVNEIWKEIENKMPSKNNSEQISDDEQKMRMPNYVRSYKTEELQKSYNQQNLDNCNATATTKSQSAWKRIVASANSSTHTEAPPVPPLEHFQLAFSFRANLPPDVPPSMSAECVRYLYSAVLVVTTIEGMVGLFYSVWNYFNP